MPPAVTHCSVVADNEGGAWRNTEPKWEPRCLVQLLGKNGHTIDKLRELIRVTRKEEAILRACRSEAIFVFRSLKVRSLRWKHRPGLRA